MKICYLILAHKNPKQINMLIESLLIEESSVVYLHISKPQFFRIKEDIICNSRVHLIENPICVEWGGDNILKAQLLLLKTAIGEKADFYQFLTGQDFPIKNNLTDFYFRHKGEIFISMTESHKEEKNRLEYYWPKKLTKLYDNKLNIYRIIRKIKLVLCTINFPFKKKKIPLCLKNIKYYKSMFWITLDLETANYILNFISDNSDCMSLFEGALNAEEGFWGTIIALNKDILSKNKTNIDLVYVSNFVNNHPLTLCTNDIDNLCNSNALFARKFDIEIDENVLLYFKKNREGVQNVR